MSATRMERLRTIVPHAERANTAAFLEEVINHILSLEQRLRELDQTAAEKKQGKEVTGTVDFQVEFDSKKRRGEIIRTSVSPVAKRSA